MIEGLVVAAILLLFLALAFVLLRYRVWHDIRLTAASVPFQDEQVFFYALTELMRTFGYRPPSIADGRRIYQQGPWRRFFFAAPVTIELSGQGSARVIGPAGLIRLVRRQFPGAVEQPYAGPQPWGTWLKRGARFCGLLGGFLVALGLSVMFLVGGPPPAPRQAPPASVAHVYAPDPHAVGEIRYRIPLSSDDAARGVGVELLVPGRREHLKVRIPAGVKDGARLRVRGQGNPDATGNRPDDLHLVIAVTQ